MKETKILRLPQVEERCGIKKSLIYNLISQGKFPPPVSLGGPRAIGWTDVAIQKWIEERPVASRVEMKEVA